VSHPHAEGGQGNELGREPSEVDLPYSQQRSALFERDEGAGQQRVHEDVGRSCRQQWPDAEGDRRGEAAGVNVTTARRLIGAAGGGQHHYGLRSIGDGIEWVAAQQHDPGKGGGPCGEGRASDQQGRKVDRKGDGHQAAPRKPDRAGAGQYHEHAEEYGEEDMAGLDTMSAHQIESQGRQDEGTHGDHSIGV